LAKGDAGSDARFLGANMSQQNGLDKESCMIGFTRRRFNALFLAFAIAAAALPRSGFAQQPAAPKATSKGQSSLLRLA